MKRWEVSLLVGFVLAIALGTLVPFAADCAAVRSETLRLHILANSDSSADQALKLAVRDEILAQYGVLFSGVSNKNEAEILIAKERENIQKTALTVLQKSGINDAVRVNLERDMYFDTKAYDGFTLPAGRYDALRIEIGAAAGRNWFCVMFPALCLPSAAKDSALKVYSASEKSVLECPYELKFAAVELFEKMKE